MATLLAKHYRRLKGQTAWILGGKRIGRTVARALAEQGVHLVVAYRHSRKEAEETVAAARRLGVRAMAIQVDASDRESVAAAIRTFRSRFPRIDLLIAMASVFEEVKLEAIGPDDWQHNIGAHILGTFWPVQLALPLMRRGGHVITVADRTSVGPVYPNYLPYVVTKGAVEHLTRSLAKELAPRGIVVNCIAPGPVLPPDHFSSKKISAIRNQSPLQIPVTSQEAVEQFALSVLYLSVLTLTSGSTYVLDQGQNL